MTDFVDIRQSTAWATTEEYFQKLLARSFGRPHRLIETAVSPDGAQVAVTGLVYDRLEGVPRQAVYLAVDSELRPVSNASGSTRAPAFSPDGETLAMLSDRAEPGRWQLVLLRRSGFAEAEATPEVPGTVEYATWSPDGRRILLGVVGLGADQPGAAGSGSNFTGDSDLPSWHPTVSTSANDQAWRSLWVYDISDGTVNRVTPQGLNPWEAAWLGNESMVAVTSTSWEEADWYHAVLTSIDLDGSAKTLATSAVQLGHPTASPDGSRLAIVEAVCSDRGLVAGDLLVGARGGDLRRIETGDINVTAAQWVDNERIGIVGLRGLETVVAVGDPLSERMTELWRSTETSCGSIHPEAAWTRDGRAIVVEHGYRQPHRVVTLSEGRSDVVAELADDGTAYMLSVCGSVEPVSWQAPDGLTIEALLALPPGDGPHPLVVNIHGGPVWSYRNVWALFYLWVPLLVSRGYAVLSPNPRGSSGRGQEFARRVLGDMGGADTYDYISGVDALVERGLVDPSRLGLIGGSYGGFMSAWLVTQDQRWAAAAVISPVVDWYSQHFTSNIGLFDALFLDDGPENASGKFHSRSPVMQVGKARTPCLNIAGMEDRCTPPSQAQEFHQGLLEHGVESALVVYPGEGHGVRSFPATIDCIARVLHWLDTYMAPERAARSADGESAARSRSR